MGKILRPSTFERRCPNKECPARRAALASTEKVLERITEDMHDYLQGCLAELVFNLDEVGILDWEHRKRTKVIIPAAMPDQTMPHRVSRNVKHISVIACLSAAGESLLRYRVTSQNSPTVQEHPKKQGVRFGRDFALKFNRKPYFKANIFLTYIRTILLPYAAASHGLAVFTQEIAVLLMDDNSAPVSDDMIRILTEARVRVITFAPRTTQVFQVFDLTLFAVLKRCPRYELSFDDDNAIVKVIMKVYHDFTQTLVPCNVWGTCPALGLEFDTKTEPYNLLFDGVHLRESAGLQAL
jgi:hypothetical protein